MNCKRVVFGLSAFFVFCMATALFVGSALSQSSSNSSSSNNNDDDNGQFSTYSGVSINAGLLTRNAALDWGNVSQRRIQAARASHAASLSQNIKKRTPLRYVSLNRLEQAIIESNGVVTEEMQCLAGLTRIQYVFYFPESKDIVIAGPAEGWFPGFEGAMVSLSEGRPVCELQDLVVALRAYGPGAEAPEVVGCSIDPTEEGNARLQQFIRQFGGRDGPGRREAFVHGLRESLGLQTVRVDGIPATTHAAMVMVAADYRMKRIGIGVERPPVPIQTFISQVDPARQAGNALYRWFFVPDYQSVLITEDRAGLELLGEGVKLVAEDEIVAATGQRTQTGKVAPASRAFSRSFTKEYPKLAKRSLVFAQLRNFVDMLVCAAHIRQQDFYSKADWSMEFLGDEGKYAVQTVNAPTHVEPVVGMREKGAYFMAPIGGGVEIEPEIALKDGNVKVEDKGQVSSVRNNVRIELKSGQWWWD